MKNSRFEVVFDNANRGLRPGKTSKHPKRMVGSTPGHTCAHDLGAGPAFLDCTQRESKIGCVLMGVVALDLEKSRLGSGLRCLNEAKTALPHRIGIAAKQIAC